MLFEELLHFWYWCRVLNDKYIVCWGHTRERRDPWRQAIQHFKCSSGETSYSYCSLFKTLILELKDSSRVWFRVSHPMKQIQITSDKTDSTFTASVCDAGSYFELNFSGCTMTIWPGEALSSLDTSELKVWRKVKSSLSAWPDRQTDREREKWVLSTPHVHLKNSSLCSHHTH